MVTSQYAWNYVLELQFQFFSKESRRACLQGPHFITKNLVLKPYMQDPVPLRDRLV